MTRFPPELPSTPTQASHLGQPMQRVEDAALLRGRGAFADDLGTRPGTLQAAVLRSPYPHARLLAVDARAALALPGVRAVLTGADIQAWAQPFVVGVKQPMQHWPLAVDRVRYVGEPVAVVIAVDRYLAEDALERIDVRYEPLPVVVGIDQALRSDAALLHDGVGSNVVSDRQFAYGLAADADLCPTQNPSQSPTQGSSAAACTRRISVTIDYPRNSCSPMECGVVIADYLGDDEGYEVTSNFMGPFSLHAVMAMALKVPGNKLRHRVPKDSGGSFGVKQAVFPYIVLMCLAARKAGAAVKWVEDRLEHLSAATSATARLASLAADVTPEGRILALHWDQVDEVGAYLRAPEPATFYRMHGCLTGPYDIGRLTVRNRVVVTNKTPTGLVRGFGGPQVYFALERLMDRIALQLAIDPLDVRRRNFVRADQFPYRAPAGALLDSGDYHALADQVAARAQQLGLYDRQRQAREAGRLYGIGMAAIVEPSVSNMGYISTVLTAQQRAKAGPKNGAIASATVAIDLLGGVNVTVASAPAGQGHRTVCAQVVADVLGLPPQHIVVNIEFDTAKDAWSVAAGNYSSRFAGAVAGVVHLAACKLRDKLVQMAAGALGCDPADVVLANGQIGSRWDSASWQPLARLAGQAHWAPALLPAGMEPGLRETVFWTPPELSAPDEADRVNTSAAYGFVFDLCGLEVDPDTGAVRIDQYITGHDAGRLLNPALADGQIQGAFAQGLGAALLEEFRYGADGSFQSGTLADYLMPTACELVDPVIIHQQTPSPITPLGAKGLGEGNNMSTPVCIANAYADALRPWGDVVDVRLPLTPGRVMTQLCSLEPLRYAQRAPLISDALSSTAGAPMTAAAFADAHGAAPQASAAADVPDAGPSLKAQGHVDLPAAPQAVFDALLDPLVLARVIPGCGALFDDGGHRFRADVVVGVGLIKARYAVRIELSDLLPPTQLRLAGQGESAMGTGRGDGMVRLQALPDGGTRLHYDYRAQVGGKVAMVGSRMLEGAARLIIGQLFEGLARQMQAAHPAERADDAPAALARPDLTWWQRLLRTVRNSLGGAR